MRAGVPTRVQLNRLMSIILLANEAFKEKIT